MGSGGMGGQIALALADAHGRGSGTGDLKFSNVMLAKENEVPVIDGGTVSGSGRDRPDSRRGGLPVPAAPGSDTTRTGRRSAPAVLASGRLSRLCPMFRNTSPCTPDWRQA
jgi:hypothetical protein